MPVVAYRLSHLRPSTYGSPSTYNNIEAILTEAELQLFLVLASATCLKPLFQPFHPGFFVAADSNIAVTGYTNRPGGKGRGEAYYELSEGARPNDRSGKKPEVFTSGVSSRDDASDQADLIQSHHQPLPVAVMRPDETANWSMAEAGTNVHRRAEPSRYVIEATHTWTVSYEGRDAAGF